MSSRTVCLTPITEVQSISNITKLIKTQHRQFCFECNIAFRYCGREYSSVLLVCPECGYKLHTNVLEVKI